MRGRPITTSANVSGAVSPISWGKAKQTVAGDAEDPLRYVIRGPVRIEFTAEWLRLYAPKDVVEQAEVVIDVEAEVAFPDALIPVACCDNTPTARCADTHRAVARGTTVAAEFGVAGLRTYTKAH